MKYTIRPKLVTKTNSLQLVEGNFSNIINLLLWLAPLLFGLVSIYIGQVVFTAEEHRYIRIGTLIYGVGLIIFSMIKAPKRLGRVFKKNATLSFTKTGITRKTLTMNNEQHYQWSDIDKLVITPNLLLNSSNYNSQQTYTILVLFNNARYAERLNAEHNATQKTIKVNGLWHTTQHHFELTLDNTVFFHQPFQESDLTALQNKIQEYTTPVLADSFELIVHPVSSVDSYSE